MIIVKDMGKYLAIYSSAGRKILERPKNILWNNSMKNPIAVSKLKYKQGCYIESNEPVDKE